MKARTGGRARFLERNAVGAALAERAEQWPYGSLRARSHAEDPTREVLADWPIERPADWVERVNTLLSAGELKRLRHSVVRCTPFGTDLGADRTARRLGLEHTLRPEGRPPKQN
jgi:putative transposase